MTPDLEAAWRRLEAEAATHPGSGLVRLRLTGERDDGLYLGVDTVTRRRVFLVAVDDPERLVRAAPRWREVRVTAIADPSAGVLIGVELENPSFRDVFGELAMDLYRTLAPLQRGPGVPRALVDRLEKWQQFFREHGFQGLDREVQRGLVGELTFLHATVLPRVPGVAGLRCWRGPEGAPHDFRFSALAVEVKATGPGDTGTVRIADERQLDDAGLPALYLYTVYLERVAEGGTSLPALVAQVRAELAADQAAIRLFEAKLVQAGYLSVHEPEYLELHRVCGDAWYRVTDGFPRIVQVPQGVSRVRYELSLAACAGFRVDGAPVLQALGTSSGAG